MKLSSLLDGLNPSQLRAVTSTAPVILTVAGAGSGKTTVLTRRVAHLHTEHRIGTSNICMFTFTRLAALEMKERVMKLIGEEQGKNLTVNTFHAFAVNVLRRWGTALGIEDNFTIYDQDDRTEIIKRIMDDFGSKVSMKKVMDRFENCQDVREEQRQYPEECKILVEYGYRCKQNNAVDIDRLVDLVVRLWNLYPKALAEYRGRYTHVFVDEYQDTNAEQATVVTLMTMLDASNLFVVGDPDQCIYEWRGAKPEYIVQFPQYYPECEVIKLEDNYRSTTQVVEPANRLIRHNQKRIDKKLIAHKSGPEVQVLTFPDAYAEAKAITEMAAKYNADGVAFKEIAVLCRTNNQVDTVMRLMEQNDIPALRVAGRDDPYRAPVVRPVLDWMQILHNSKDNIAFKKAIRKFRLTDMQLAALELKATQEDCSLSEAADGIILGFSDLCLTCVTEINEREAYNALEQFDVLRLLLDTPDHPDADKARFAIEVWQKSKQLLNENCSAGSFLKFLRYRDIQEKLIEQKDAVKLMTIHASKGLEFDTVFVAGLNDGIFPSQKGDIEEERRLFYVAITRAKNNLVITWPQTAQDFRGSPKPAKVSPFIEELGL